MSKSRVKFEDIIIDEVKDYIVVNKPPFISSLDDRFDDLNIKDIAKDYLPTAQLAHRLDKDTSGILVIAKNEDAYRNFAIQLEKREVDKVYHAVVNGIHDIEGIQVEAPIAYKPGNNKVRIDFGTGKQSLTLFKTGKIFQNHTLMYCKPVTGRMHQIRVHLAHLKMPITCDNAYGGQTIYLSDLKKNYNLSKGREEQPLIKRFALHSSEISFKDLEGETVTFKAEYPKDFKVLVKQLEKFS